MTDPDRPTAPPPDRLRSECLTARRPERLAWTRVLFRVVVVQGVTLLLLWLLQVRYG